ncbi:mitogen-activated protein kinase kinase kinase 4-like [Diadema antillarum]|uniref:mitogen-activated protein kinase kinase kinase 4-like n=1 Tax=Diadema antillarum TaxID=105358 RepID=UPI003A88F313
MDGASSANFSFDDLPSEPYENGDHLAGEEDCLGDLDDTGTSGKWDAWEGQMGDAGNDDSPPSIDGEGSFDDNQAGMYDNLYGSTPPRQMRSARKQTSKGNSGKGGKPPRLVLQVPQKKDARKDRNHSQAKKSLAKKLDSADYGQSAQLAKQKFHQRKMRSIHLDRTSEREFKQKAITYDGSELHQPLTPTYTFRPFDSLPSPNLKIGSSTCFRSVKSQQVSPPSSPGSRTKKHSSSSSKSYYAAERVEFHRTFSALIRMGSSTKKETSQEHSQRIRRQDGMAHDMFQMQWTEMLWLELMAYYNSRDIDEQDLHLFEARKQISEIISEILEFRFQNAASNQTVKSKCSLDRKRSSFKSVQRNIAKHVSGQSSTSSSSSQGDSVDTTQLNGTACDTCMMPGHRRQPSVSDICMPLSAALNSYITDTCDAWYRINYLLKKLEQIQSLYPTSKAFLNDVPEGVREDFTKRVETMCLWLNLTNDISHKFDLTSQILGVIDLENLWWPCLDLPGYCVENCDADDLETDQNPDVKPMVKPTARRPMLGALGHWDCVQSHSQDMLQGGASCDTQSTSLSHDRLDSRDLSHDRLDSREQSHDRLDSRDMSHDRLDSRDQSHDRLDSRDLSHNRLDSRDMSHDRLDSRDMSHDRLDSRNASLDRNDGAQKSHYSMDLGHHAVAGSANAEPCLPGGDPKPRHNQDDEDYCSEVSFGSQSVLNSSLSRHPPFNRVRSVTFDISPNEEERPQSPRPSAEPVMSSTPQAKSPRAEESPRTNRIFSECHFSFDYDSSTSIYRPFVDRSLKHQGLRKMTKRLDKMLGQTNRKLRFAIEKASDVHDNRRISTGSDVDITLRVPQFFETPPQPTGQPHPTLQSHGTWSKEFQEMNLPSFMPAYLFLVRIPLDVMHECLRFRLEHKPAADPSRHSIQQLIRECKEVIGACTHVKQYYHDMVSAVTLGDSRAQEHVDNDIEEYESDLQEMLQVYFEYVHSRMLMLQRLPQASMSLKNVLEEEWTFAKEMCPFVRAGEAQAGKRFCIMASNLLQSTFEYLEEKVDDVCMSLQDSESASETTRHIYRNSCRKFRELFFEVRDRSAKALGFAKMLSKDLEIAAAFKLNTSMADLTANLKLSGHVRVLLSSCPGYQVFVPQHLHNNVPQILHLLNDLCGREDFLTTSDPTSPDPSNGYLLLVKDVEGELASTWGGDTTSVNPNIETTIATSDIQVDSILLVVNHFSELTMQRKAFQRAMSSTVTLVNEQTSSHNTIADALEELKDNALTLCHKIVEAISLVEENLDVDSVADMEETERMSIAAYFRDAMCQCFSVAFEYHKEVSRLLSNKQGLGESILKLAQKWMNFVLKKFERGKGCRPRWSNQGFEFLILACEPRNVTHLMDEEFQELQSLMMRCIQHVIGQGKPSPASPVRIASPDFAGSKVPRIGTRSSKSSRTSSSSEQSVTSPTSTGDLRRIPSMERFLSIASSSNTSPTEDRLDPGFPRYDRRASPNPFCSTPAGHSQVFRTLSRDVDGTPSGSAGVAGSTSAGGTPAGCARGSIARRVSEIEELERKRTALLQSRSMIGRVSDQQHSQEVVNINCKKVTFRWQRGFKIGEGQFGTTVYSCINMNTGETLAVKEMRFQRNDHQVIRDIADEIKNLEGIRHPNLVKYYGVEIHREELLIFMEYCDEGTIAEVAKTGLPEEMIRQYTREITIAVSVLHDNNIIHRDIKGANIFLSSDGHVKLGDFGAAIKLKTHTTMHGEVNTTMGTAAYMAPEVITQSGKGKEGYGRQADIWSLGCVVIEMVTGKRPWHDYDHEYTIMYKVGEGAIPNIPENMSAEGQDFLKHCLKHEANRRWSASDLLNHPFIKVAGEVIEEGIED